MSGYNPQLNPLALDTLPIVPLINLRPSLGRARQDNHKETSARPAVHPVKAPALALVDLPVAEREHDEKSTVQVFPEIKNSYTAAASASAINVDFRPGPRKLRPLARLSGQDSSPAFYMSLSDLMCLLLVFFILIFSLTERGESRVPNQEALQPLVIAASPKVPDPFPQPAPVSLGIRKGLLGLTAMGQMDPGLASERVAMAAEPPATSSFSPQDEDRQNLLGQIRAAASQIPGLEVAVRGENVIIRFPETLLFESGQAGLNPNLQPTLQRLGQVVRAFPQTKVNITGHTDNRPISTMQFASNWELSGARAAAVARGLVQGGLDPARVTIKGMADQVPLLPNTNDNNRMRNRRVEIELSS